ncbi:enhancer of split m4 protein [Drosophila guanche]|uniref:Blast:Enhancer of split m4 protein n=1 Tax=Drosophila guanche TaxID=7266 RepID=A0A3B0KLT5_DROGU|nr:enhancer of split m4 protein [Drosophila guanche]SPP89580.1 blast:Enhancer of split m4 protein [Drosophila guanche]
MCQNKGNNTMTIKSNKKLSYSVKKLLQKIFKQQQFVEEEQNLKNSLKVNSLESLESIENSRNADLESASVCASMESYENKANERLSASCDMEDYELEQLPSVPVHFVRTAHGTFFWTAASDLPADNDLCQPLSCSTANEIAVAQHQDRWVQA